MKLRLTFENLRRDFGTKARRLGIRSAFTHMTAMVNVVNRAFRQAASQSLFPRAEGGNDVSLEHTRHCADAAIAWILRQQAMQPDGGVTAGIEFSLGRQVVRGSYPEVTGYTIVTLFEYARLFHDKKAFDAAVRAAEFELPFQMQSGAFPGGYVRCLSGPSVFNSSQVVHGLVRAHAETGDERFLDAATRCCDWICESQDSDGAWGRSNYLGMKRTYDTKVCQALLETAQARPCEEYRRCAARNLDYALRHQMTNGWFLNCDNSWNRNYAPLTHTIGYTIEGLMGCYAMTRREDLLVAARTTLDGLLHAFEQSRRPLPGRMLSNWKGAVQSTCVTGDAQIAACWFDQYRITGRLTYANAALKMMDFLKSIQFKNTELLIHGALPSSYPFWGDYNPYVVNSWGVKYYVDALLKEYCFKQEMERCAL